MFNTPRAKINFIVLFITIFASGFLVFGSPIDKSITYNPNLVVDNNTNATTSAQQAIQINSLAFVTLTPTPTSALPTPSPTTPVSQIPPPPPYIPTGPACNHDNGQTAINSGVAVASASATTISCTCPDYANLYQCVNRQCIRVNVNGQWVACASPLTWCNSGLAPTDGIFCIGKPVIYLYPETPTYIDVSVKSSGEIFISDPLYPPNGWKNVLAHPDGNLLYEGKEYKELFYETNVTNLPEPLSGLTLTTNNLAPQLQKLLTRLGLNKAESDEFIEYWVPRLTDLNSPFIQFSLIEKNVKDVIDTVIINPEPDTRIEFLVHFKPLMTPYSGKPLILPTTPERRGFVMVEWGGTIEN